MRFAADCLHDSGATAVQELGYAIGAKAVERLAAARTDLAFVFARRVELLLRDREAARRTPAVGANGVPHPMNHLSHARRLRGNKSIYDPYTNLLRATTEALSAAIGGCDTLEVRPFGFSTSSR